uniref:U-actitoxin-Avd8a n=1 Tax=Anemonia viridis TaxID=51769 RepID=TX8A_ANEVI|nr:RecName: Full=U-actitoxin-Avd8a; Short=U-AITX-Avd8a; AltName: Full=Avtx-1; Flags: Precursor [Anemonia viridis]
MKSLVIVFVVLLGVAMISANEEELLAILQDQRNDARGGCMNRYKSNICGTLVTPMNCIAPRTRMGKFARKFCQFMCGIC